mgnify:CR=1 FL=1
MMDIKTMNALFKKYEDTKFEDLDAKDCPSNRPDLVGFLTLDRVCPGTCDMVAAAEHDQIFLEIDPEVFLANATEDTIRILSACGIWYDADYDSFTMFV